MLIRLTISMVSLTQHIFITIYTFSETSNYTHIYIYNIHIYIAPQMNIDIQNWTTDDSGGGRETRGMRDR